MKLISKTEINRIRGRMGYQLVAGVLASSSEGIICWGSFKQSQRSLWWVLERYVTAVEVVYFKEISRAYASLCESLGLSTQEEINDALVALQAELEEAGIDPKHFPPELKVRT